MFELKCADCGRVMNDKSYYDDTISEILGYMIHNKPICTKCAGKYYTYTANGELILNDDVQSVYINANEGVKEIDTESDQAKS